MPTASPVVVTKLEQLKADAVMHRERITRELDPATIVSVQDLATWLRNELAFNLMPMFEGVVDAAHEDLGQPIGELRRDVDDILDDSGDMLTEETAGQIVGVFEQGRVICNLLEAVTKHADNVTRKRAAAAIKLYRSGEMVVREIVMAITMPDDGEEEEGEGEPAAPGEGDPAPLEGDEPGDEPELAAEGADAGGEG